MIKSLLTQDDSCLQPTCFLSLLLIVALLIVPFVSLAQVQSPTDEFLFREDSKQAERIRSREIDRITQVDPAPRQDVQFEAGEVTYLQEESIIRGTKGVVVSAEGTQLQGDRGQVNLDTNDASFEGNVLMSSPQGVVSAEKIDFNFDTELGEFEDSEFTLEDGAYKVSAQRAEKFSETSYSLEDCYLTTCYCSDGSLPWRISSSRVNVTEEGYAHAYGTTFKIHGVPIFYSPWFAFPVKQERQSGLLIPSFGYSSEDGALTELPTYLVIDDYSDLTISPFIESNTRQGVKFDYRKVFSQRGMLDGGLVYSNERPRDGELRGTNTTDLFDPEIDDDRLGGYLTQRWRTDRGAIVPLQYQANIKLISDNLMLRELDLPDIGSAQDRYTRSNVSLSSSFGSYVTASVAGEYNQSLLTDQDRVFQRLPTVTINGLRSFRPFGTNPYGLRVASRVKLESTDFVRSDGYDGRRIDLNPSIRIPFYYKNYLNNELSFGLNHTVYDLRDTAIPGSEGDRLDSSLDRTIGNVGYEVSTALERVYELPENSWLRSITSLGSRNQAYRLQRIKHTLEPLVRYNFVPGVSQDDLPLFDSFDRMRERSLVTYELRSRLLGSFRPATGMSDSIEELTPEIEELPTLNPFSALSDLDGAFGQLGTMFSPSVRRARTGRSQIRELATIRLLQSYDIAEDRNDNDLERDPLSDLSMDLGIYPTPDFGLRFINTYNVEETNFSSWGVQSHFQDDRGDALRVRYSYVEDRVSQVEGNLEIVLTDRVKFGYYARFDDRDHEFVEQRGAFRFSSQCDCWHIDVGMSDQINPDKKKFLVNFSLEGLGDIVQDFGVRRDRDEESDTL